MKHRIIGLTGGIGSGKSTVAKLLQVLGWPVFNSDKAAHQAYFIPEVKEKVRALLGDKVYLSVDTLNKSYIANAIFSDEKKLSELNQLIHPAVGRLFNEWLQVQASGIVVKESALVFETGMNKLVEKVVLVKANEAIKIKRVMARDGLSETDILKRMKKQWSDEQKEQMANYIIYNDEHSLLIPQVLSLQQKIINN